MTIPTTWWWSSLVIHDLQTLQIFIGTLQLSQLELPWPHPNSSTSERRAVKIGHGWTHGWSYKGHKNTKVRKETICSLNIWSQKLRMALSWKKLPICEESRNIATGTLPNQLLTTYPLWCSRHVRPSSLIIVAVQKIPFPACNPDCSVFLPLVILFVLIHNTRLLIYIDCQNDQKLLWFPGPNVALKKGYPFPRRVTNFHWSLPGAPEAAAVQKTRDDFDSDRSRSKCILRLHVHVYHIIVLWQHYLFFLGTIPCYLKCLGTHPSLEAKSTILGQLQCWISHHDHPFVCL